MTALSDQSRTLPDGRTGPRASTPVPEGAEFMTARQLAERRGGCSIQTIDRQIEEDDAHPRPIYFGRLRYFRIADVLEYERLCEQRAIEKAAAKAAARAAR